MNKLLLFLSLLIFHYSFSIAEVRYVSHSGTNTPPYLTWETAADSIMSAINISSFGDTIYVANGVYEELVVMIPGLSLIGEGADSCMIDTRNFTAPQSVKVKNDCLLKNFKIIVQNSVQLLGAGIVINYPNSIVEYNEVSTGRSEGIWCYNTNAIVRHNKILNFYWGIQIEFNQPTIDSNYIYVEQQAGTGIGLGLNSYPIIRGNFVWINNYSANGIQGGFNQTSRIFNNTVYSVSDDNVSQWGITSYGDTLRNNIISGQWDLGVFTADSDIRNNNIDNSRIALRYDVGSGGAAPVFRYNNLWENQSNYQNFTPDSTNIYSEPMFVNEDSLDFHLQEYSPLIDAGDPAIFDKDGTRSDIGLYGGPYGESYNYLDLPPGAPVNLSGIIDSNITLRWNKNTEADLSHYNLYRDTLENFGADSTTFIASVTDTFYLQTIPKGIDNLYFKLRAVDNQGNQSDPSEELHIILTGIINNEQLTISNYRLYQNYPNPFNPTTKIGYRLKERGYVKLYVYDIKGELVETLVNKYQEGGYYEVEFNSEARGQRSEAGGTGRLASGIYIYQIMIKNERNIPVFTDIKKMIYIK